MITIRTIGDLIDRGYALSVHCMCVGAQYPDLQAIADRCGRDTPWVTLRGRLRCRKCYCLGDSLQIHSVATMAIRGDFPRR